MYPLVMTLVLATIFYSLRCYAKPSMIPDALAQQSQERADQLDALDEINDEDNEDESPTVPDA